MSNLLPAVPPPTPSIAGLMATVSALKQSMDVLSGQAGATGAAVQAGQLQTAVSSLGKPGNTSGSLGAILLDSAVKDLHKIFNTELNTTKDALTATLVDLTSTVNNNTAAISSEATTRANADSSLSASITSLTSTVNGNTASISTESATRASADSTLSGQITTAQAQLDTATATGNMQLIAVASPQSGVAAEFSVNVRANNGSAFAQTGLRLRAMTSGGSEFLVQAAKFIISSGSSTDGTGTDHVPFTINTSGNLESQAVLNGSLIVTGSITADKLSVTSLSALSANIGTVTTGVLQDAGGHMVIDLTNATITGYA